MSNRCLDRTCGNYRAGLPFVAGRDCPACWNGVNRLGLVIPSRHPAPSKAAAKPAKAKALLARVPLCVHLGAKAKPECACEDRICNVGKGTVKHRSECQTCESYEATAKRASTAKTAPAVVKDSLTTRRPRNHVTAGVVIGSYKWPSLVALQIAAIRRTCGPVPILVSSDDPSTAAQVQAACDAASDVWHWPNHDRIGHTGGDISAFFKGALWGRARGLKVVAKLSQRFVVTRPRWLQDGAADLLESGLSLASQRCTGVARYDLRTEACLLDVAAWSRPEVLSRIVPRKYWRDSPNGLTAETVIYRVLQDLCGEFFLPWSLFGEDREAKYPGVVWHNSHDVADYRKLAAEHGVELDAGYHCDGWMQDLKAGKYLYG